MTPAQTLISELRARADLSVSNDVAGIFGSPVRSERFWQAVLNNTLQFQMEQLSWRWLLSTRTATPAGNLPRLSGYHGRMGIWNSDDPSLFGLTMGNLLDSLLTPTSQMQRLLREQQHLPAVQRPLYLLLHHPEAADAFKLFERDSAQGFVVAIENHTRPEAVQEVWRLVDQYTRAKIPAVMVFDLVHALNSLPAANFEHQWETVLDQLHQTGQCLVHIPIGTRSSDSLNPDQLSSSQLGRLGQIMQQNQNYAILEHQLGTFDGKFFPVPEPAHQPKLVARTRDFVHRLQHCGVLPAQSAQ